MAVKRAKKRKKQHPFDYLGLGILLALICIISASALSFTYSMTLKRIEEQKIKKLMESLPQVLPHASHFSGENHLNELLYYVGYNEQKTAGYALCGSVQGYQSVIKFIVGVNIDGMITGLQILEHAETPGLGARITELKNDRTLRGAISAIIRNQTSPENKLPEPWFTALFKQKHYDTLALGVEGEHIAAITGATITSSAVVEGVKSDVKKFFEEIQVKP
ncbi:MAG: RnfABCDGE type electron transport complex subunit G [bacterium]|nr:RnfABCDGE type electron transport complex subunit G [bacterium]